MPNTHTAAVVRPTVPTVDNVDTALNKFIAHKTANGTSPATIATYRSRLRLFGRWLRHNQLQLANLTHEHLDQWVISLRQQNSRYNDSCSSRPTTSGALSAHTIAGRIRATKTFLKFCHERRYIPINPASQLKQGKLNHSATSRAISESDMYKMFDAAHSRWMTLSCPRDFAILLFAADTGARRGEIATLTLANLDLDRHEAIVHGKTGERTIDFTAATANVLSLWIDHRSHLPHTSTHGRVWTAYGNSIGLPLTSNGLYQIFKRTAAAAAINSRFNPQAFRHRLGRTLVERDVSLRNIMEKLGHTSIYTTAAFYTTPTADHIKQITRHHSPTTGYTPPTTETAS